MRQFFLTITITISVAVGFAQSNGDGDPLSWGMPDGVTSNVIWYELPSFNTDSLQALPQSASEAFKFAEFVPRLFDPQTSGRWTNLAGGDRLWTIGISLPNAYSLSPIFDQLILPIGSRLYIYSEDEQHVIGPFDRNNVPTGRRLAPIPIQSNRIIIEYYEPYPMRGQGRLRLAGVSAGFINFTEAMIDANCRHLLGDEERRNMASAFRSCVMLVTDRGQCLSSGVLVNNTMNDGRPMVLTASAAFHESDLSYTAVIFRYDDPQSQAPVVSWDRAVYGAGELYTEPEGGIKLVLLDHSPKNIWGTFLSGWNRAPQTGQRFVNFHFGFGQTLQSSFATTGIFSADQRYTVSNRIYGGALPGSLGGPLFNMNGEVIGVLTHSDARCSTTGEEIFASMSGGWQGLKNFLAPNLPESLFQPGLSYKSPEVQISDNRGIYCYPNPSNKEITIKNQTGDKLQGINVVDFAGRIVLTASSPEDKIEVSALPAGTYIIQYYLEKGMIREKLVVQ